MIRSILLLTLGLLAGCSSTPQQLNYYFLTPSGEAIETDKAASSQEASIVLLEEIRLADYLNQSSLTMQLNDYQLYYARQHIWAEPLQSSISKALLNDLNRQRDLRFIGLREPSGAEPAFRLSVQIDHFVATDNAEVIASGKYWLANGDGQLLLDNSFALERSLQRDGYLHAVEQLRGLLAELAQQIGLELVAITEIKNRN